MRSYVYLVNFAIKLCPKSKALGFFILRRFYKASAENLQMYGIIIDMHKKHPIDIMEDKQ